MKRRPGMKQTWLRERAQLIKRAKKHRAALEKHAAELDILRREIEMLDDVYANAIWHLDDAINGLKEARYWWWL